MHVVGWAPDERFIDDVFETYEKVYPNLKVHNPSYPAPAVLKSKSTWGNVEFDGDYSKDTPGSDLIKSLLLDNQPGPLFVTAQGGQSTIARALKSIADQHSSAPEWPAIRERASRKLIIVPFGDQDGTSASYIRPNWPDVETWLLDRDDVTVRWWHYQDAGTYPGDVMIRSATSLDTTFQIPGDAQSGQTIHMILEASDRGTPSMTRYQRVIVTVVPVAP